MKTQQYGGQQRPHKSTKCSYPYMKKPFKTQQVSIQHAAIEHRFIAPQKRKIDNCVPEMDCLQLIEIKITTVFLCEVVSWLELK